jgi:hypothetical protein
MVLIKCNCESCKARRKVTSSEEMLAALKTMVLDKQHREWMQDNDPKALEQAEHAIAREEREVYERS